MAETWEARFRAPRWRLPAWAAHRPGRCVVNGSAGGVWEIYAWDADTGAAPRRVTSRPNGTRGMAITPDGEDVWWFADRDGDEFGIWMQQPFDGGPNRPAAALDPAYPAGLVLGRSLALVGRSTDEGTTIHVVPKDGGEPRVLYGSAHDAHVAALSDDESLAVIAHSEHGDSRHMALRVLRLDGSPVADLWDGPGKGLSAAGFPTRRGDSRLLVGHERRGREELLVWDPLTGEVTELAIDLPGELAGEWYADGSAVLVHREHQGRADLHRYDVATGTVEPLATPRGLVAGATPRPDGSVWFAWSSAAQRPQILDLAGREVLAPPGPLPPPSVDVEDVFVERPYGTVHALLSRPPGSAPYAGVFVVHGGPTDNDADTWRPDVASHVDDGYAVVQVNYRGSTGYGSAWRDAIEASPGLTELEDIRAVREHLVAAGVLRDDAVALVGASWGGYLTLLGLGTQPDAWAAGVAEVPVADYVAAYEDEMEPLRAFDRSLFGGSPEEVPDRYRAASPITYVGDVRAPVLVVAGANDPRCPIRQIDNYLAALERRGAAHEVYRYDAGHGSLVVEEQIRQQAAALDFIRRHMPAADSP
jgi:dienelactone hydrolase